MSGSMLDRAEDRLVRAGGLVDQLEAFLEFEQRSHPGAHDRVVVHD